MALTGGGALSNSVITTAKRTHETHTNTHDRGTTRCSFDGRMKCTIREIRHLALSLFLPPFLLLLTLSANSMVLNACEGKKV